MTEHTKVIKCSCGETFNDEAAFEMHRTKETREQAIKEMKEVAESHGMTVADMGDEISIGFGEWYGITINREYH